MSTAPEAGSKPRTPYRMYVRHPAEVTADRLAHAIEKWPDAFDGRDRDAIGGIIHVLNNIAAGVES